MKTKVYLRRDYLICAVLQVLYFTAILFYFFVNACYGSNLIFKEKIVYNKESLENTVKIIEFSDDVKFKHIKFSNIIPNIFTKKNKSH